MTKIFLYMSIMAFGFCYGATGSASDGELALFAVIAILLLPVAAIYFIHFLKITIHDFRTRRLLKKHMMENNGEGMN